MKRLLIYIILALSFTGLQASVAVDYSEMAATADSAYAAKKFTAAAELYATLSDSTHSADAYYNLGNAEFRLKHYPQAVLAYLRALREDPAHDDARYNLSIVRTRLTDRFSKPSEMFFVSWLREFVTTRSVSDWVCYGQLWLILFFVGLGGYYISNRLALRKIGFFFAFFCVLCSLTSHGFAFYQRYLYYHNSEAVIIADEIQLYGSPTRSSKALQKIHEGTTVCILAASGKDWLHVQLPDGNEAYMPVQGYECVVK